MRPGKRFEFRVPGEAMIDSSGFAPTSGGISGFLVLGEEVYGSSGFCVGNRSAPSPLSEGEGGGECARKKRPLAAGGPRTLGSSTPSCDTRWQAGPFRGLR